MTHHIAAYTSFFIFIFQLSAPFYSTLPVGQPFSARFFFNATLRDPKREQRRKLALPLLLDAAAHSLMGGQETVTAPRPFMQAMSPKKATLTLDGDGVRSKLAALARAARLPGVSCGT